MRLVLGVEGRPSKEKRRAIVHLALPVVPSTLFYAFQGQMSLLLITFFGRTTAVASLGALNRLSRFFILFAQMNPVLIEPYFAKLAAAKLKRNYLGVIAIEGAFCLLMIWAAHAFPEVFLWVLGPKYSSLHFEVMLAVAASSISFLFDVIVVMNNARRFVYWSNGIATIVLVLAVQIFFIWKVDLSSVANVLYMNVASALVVLLINALTGVYGFIFGPRKNPNLSAVSGQSDFAEL